MSSIKLVELDPQLLLDSAARCDIVWDADGTRIVAGVLDREVAFVRRTVTRREMNSSSVLSVADDVIRNVVRHHEREELLDWESSFPC